MTEFSRAPVEQLPSVNPAEQLIPNDTVQFLEVAKPESRTGGESYLDMSQLSPLQSRESGFKVGDTEGDLMAVIIAGEQRIGIIDTKTEAGYGADYFMDGKRFIFANMVAKGSDASPAYNVATLPDGKPAAEFINEPDTTTKLGRGFQSRPLDAIGVTASTDIALSNEHVRFRLDEQGMLQVKDMKSRNGLKVAVRPAADPERTLTTDEAKELYDTVYQQSHVADGVGHVALGSAVVEPVTELITGVPPNFLADTADPSIPRYYEAEQPFKIDRYAASQVEDLELIREVANGGKVIDKDYKANQTNARQYLLDKFDKLYASDENFKQLLKNAHKLAAAGDVYGKIGTGTVGLDESSHGVLRDETTVLTNSRINSAIDATSVAQRYSDPYADRFERAHADGFTTNKLVLEGIEEKYLPQDTVFYNDKGFIEKYEFSYPPGEGMDAYMGRIRALGAELSAELGKPKPDKAKALELIARQYQYGAVARPFRQINNSLFMNLANMQIKMLGMKGITHGKMDHVAQRIQPENFARYFIDRVEGREV